MRLLLVYNPRAGGRRVPACAGAVSRLLAAAGWSVRAEPTRGPGTAGDIVREHRAGLDGVWCLGGDGTVNDLLPALVGSGLPLGVLPGGTANVVARELGLPKDALAAARRLLGGGVRPVTTGCANGRPFLAMAGAGFDAAVTAAVSARLKRWTGRAAFAAAALRTWAAYPYPLVTFQTPAGTLAGTFGVAANTRRYGGGWPMAPSASLGDPRLDLVVFRGGCRLRYLQYLARLPFGRHVRGADVRLVRAERFTLRAGRPFPYQVDGEYAGEVGELEIIARPASLALWFPAPP